MSYVYKKSEPGLWTVGFYEPDGAWLPESDHETPELAAARCAMLNGGQPEGTVGQIYPGRREVAMLERSITAVKNRRA